MFKAILMTQRNATITALAMTSVFTLLFFGVILVEGGGIDLRTYPAAAMLEYGRVIGVIHFFAALLTGVLAVAATGEGDVSGKHIYALSLPVPRWHYLLLRFGAGMVIIAGCWAVLTLLDVAFTMLVTLPEGMHAYPFLLGLRFFFAALLLYAAAFAVSTLDQRLGLIWFLGVPAALWLTFWIASLLTHQTVWGLASRILLLPASPLRIFVGSWALIDV